MGHRPEVPLRARQLLRARSMPQATRRLGHARPSRGRVDADLLAEVGWPPSARPHCYVCGPTPFVEAVANTLVGLGHDPSRIKTERFGPTGG